MSGRDHHLVVAHSLSSSATDCASNEPAELVCNRCQPLEARVAQLEQALRSLSDENTVLHTEIAGLQIQLRSSGAREVSLRNELTRVREEDPKAEEIRGVLDYWKRKLGHPRAKCPLDGKRAGVVRKALRHHKATELMEAIEGLALLPYVGGHGRRAMGDQKDRYDDVEHCLRDEPTIARFRGYAQRASSAAVQETSAMFETYTQVTATQGMWESLVLGAICRREWQEMTAEQRDEFRAQFADVVQIRRENREGPDQWEQAA